MSWTRFSPGPPDAWGSGYIRRTRPWSSSVGDLLWRPPVCQCEVRETDPLDKICLGPWSRCRLATSPSSSLSPPRWLTILGTVLLVWGVKKVSDFLVDDLVPFWGELPLLLLNGLVLRIYLQLVHDDLGVDLGHVFMGPGEAVLIRSHEVDQSSP